MVPLTSRGYAHPGRRTLRTMTCNMLFLVLAGSGTWVLGTKPVFKEHVKIDEFGIKDLDNIGMRMCVSECRKRALCKTMAFNSDVIRCKLHNITIDSAEKAMLTLPSPSTTLSEIHTWETKAGPCQAKRCGANARCNVKDAATARCIITECSETPNVPNATPLPCSRAVQTNVSFKCAEGHVVVDGPAVLTCLANGSWTWPTFKCLVDCGAPPSVNNANFPQGITFTQGSHVTYTCVEGMHPERGRASTECLESGLWVRPNFVCLKDRHKLLSVGPGGQMIQFDLPPGREKPDRVEHRSHCVREAVYDIFSGNIYFSAVGRPCVVGFRTPDDPTMKAIMFGYLAVGIAADSLENVLFSCYYAKRYIKTCGAYGQNVKKMYVASGAVTKLALDRDKRYVYFACSNSIGRIGYDGLNYVRMTRTARPAGIYLHDNVLYICSSVTDDIRSFNLTNNKLQTIMWAESDTASRCWDILAAKGHIYVSYIRKSTIGKFSLIGDKEDGLNYHGIYKGIRALAYLP